MSAARTAILSSGRRTDLDLDLSLIACDADVRAEIQVSQGAVSQRWSASADATVRVRTDRLGPARFATFDTGGASARTLTGVVRLVVPRHDQLRMEIGLGDSVVIEVSAMEHLTTAHPRLEQEQPGEGCHEPLECYDDGHTPIIVAVTPQLEDFVEKISGTWEAASAATGSRRRNRCRA
jgi:hypothetical protein